MKSKIIILIVTIVSVILTLSIAFSICYINIFSKTYHWQFELDLDHIEQIRIIDVKNDDIDNSTVLKEIDPAQRDELCSEIEDLNMKRYGPSLSHPNGKCIFIVFDDGSYDVIAQEESKHFKYDEKYDRIVGYNSWYYCDEDEFDALIYKYLSD